MSDTPQLPPEIWAMIMEQRRMMMYRNAHAKRFGPVLRQMAKNTKRLATDIEDAQSYEYMRDPSKEMGDIRSHVYTTDLWIAPYDIHKCWRILEAPRRCTIDRRLAFKKMMDTTGNFKYF